jgi:hypothetical protein
MTASTETRPSSFAATCIACRVDFRSTDAQPDHDHASDTRLAATAGLVESSEASGRDRSRQLR